MLHARKLVGGIGVVGLVLGVSLSRSHVASGDTSAPKPVATDDGTAPGFGAPYAFGPGAIGYANADTATRADADSVRQRIEAAQGAESYLAFSAASKQSADDAQAEIAARQVGLEGAADQGVVP